MAYQHQCSYDCGLGSTLRSAREIDMEEARRLRLRVAARPTNSHNTWTPGKRAYFNAWTQTDLPSSAFKASTNQPVKDTGQFGRNFDILYVHETKTDRKLGVFSGRDLPKGYRVIVERPTLSCFHWSKGKRTAVEEWLKLSYRDREHLRVWFRKLRKMPHGGNDTIREKDKKALEKFITDYAFSDPQRDRAHIYRLTSHINHACRRCANAQQWVDSAEPNEMSIRLVREVKNGDEIFICYNKTVSFGCAQCPQGRPFSRRLRTFVNDIWEKYTAKLFGDQVYTEEVDKAADDSGDARRSSGQTLVDA